MAVRRRRVLTGLRAKRGGEMMPFFVATQEPPPGQGVVVVGPFSDRAAAEAQRPTRDGAPVPAHVIEASTVEEARHAALQAFGFPSGELPPRADTYD